MGGGGDNRMLLRSFVRGRVAWGNFRDRLHDRLVVVTGSERGSVAAEYALLVTLIAIVIVVGAFALGTAINNRLSTTANCVATTTGAPC
jgi:Flp pilus assembly pilin Flp